MDRQPFWALRLVIGIALLIIVMVVVLGRPFSEPIRGYFMRDYVRGDSVIAVRLPHTSGAEGYVNVTTQHELLNATKAQPQLLSNAEFQALLRVREEWCQKPDSTFTKADQTPNYIFAVQCKPLNRQFELTNDQLPTEIRQLLKRVESH